MTIVLAGDQFQVRQELDKIKRQFKKDQPDSPIEFKSAAKFSLDGLVSQISTQSLFSQTRLLILSDLSNWLDQAKDKPETNPANLVSRLCQTDSTTNLVIILGAASKIKAAWLKSDQVDFRRFKSKTRGEIKTWIKSEFDNLDIKISPSTISLLAEMTNFQPELIKMEIDKLSCHDEVGDQLIKDLTPISPQSRSFDLVDNICRGNIAKALDIYSEQRSLGEVPIKILGLINWQIRNLILVKTKTKTVKEIATELNLRSDYSLVKAATISRRLGKAQIKQLIDCLERADYRLRCQFLNPDRCLEALIIKSCYLIGRRF